MTGKPIILSFVMMGSAVRFRLGAPHSLKSASKAVR